MKLYPYKDPAYFQTVDAVLEEIDRILAHLETHSHELDDLTGEADTLVWYGEQVDWLKLYYERAERLLRNES